MIIQIIIPTFEPEFKFKESNNTLLEFYYNNIISWLSKSKNNSDIEIRICVVDYKSSTDFRTFLGRLTSYSQKISLILGEYKTSSVNALNIGLQNNKNADIFVYAASDAAAGSTLWVSDLLYEFNNNPKASIIFSTSANGGSIHCDQIQLSRIKRPPRILKINEQPNPNVVFFRANLLEKFNFSIGNVVKNDLGYSLVWMALALNTVRIMSYLLFVHHENFLEGGRHDRGGQDGYIKPVHIKSDRRAQRLASRYFQIPTGILPNSLGGLTFENILPNYKSIKERRPELAKIIYCYYIIIRISKKIYVGSGFWYFYSEISKLGFLDFIFQKYRAKKKLDKFMSLKPQERIALVLTCFFNESN